MEQEEASLAIPLVTSVATMNVGNELAPDHQLVRVIQEMNPDILALQELSERQADHLAEALAEILPHRFSFGDGHEGRGIFSRYPFRRTERLEISTARPDGLVEVDIDGQPVTVLVGHPRPPKLRGATLDIPFALHRQL